MKLKKGKTRIQTLPIMKNKTKYINNKKKINKRVYSNTLNIGKKTILY